MAGYIRQSSFSDGDTITAALFNNEYNQLLNAFSNTSGHAHDGTSAEGPVIGLIGDAGETSPNNKVLIDTSNNYIEFYVEVSSSSVQQLYIADGAIVPVTDNDIDLGTSSLEFKDGYFDGTLYADAINFNGTAITSTAAELNILDGVTASATDINLIDGITNGTVIASKAIITDSNKDITGGRNITISGELDAATLDISGDADIDGTLEADAITIAGVTLAETISDTVGAMVGSNTETGISVTYDDSDNTLDFVIGADSIVSSMLDTNIDIAGTLDVTGVLTADTNATVAGTLGVAGGSTNGVAISQGAIAIKNGGTQSYVDFYCESSNAHYTRLQAAAHSAYSGNVTATLPVTTGTLAITSEIPTTEQIQDIVGAMVSSNTETNITITYQDSDGTLDFVVDAAQPNVTSLGTLTSLTVDDVVIDGAVIGHTSDTDLITLSSGVVTVAGELDATSLDISGDADIDGTLEADAITIGGVTLAETISDTVGAMVTSNTESGITVAYQDADNTLDFTIGTLNQDTTGTAAVATTVTITDNESTNEENAVVFTAGGDVDGGNLGLESDGNLTYNPSSGTLTATAFAGALTGNVTGNASGTAATVTGAAQSNITSLGTLTTLTVDNVIINGTTIGHTSDTDLMTLADGVLTVAGEVSMTTLDIGGTNVTSTAAELNILDGVTASATDINLIDGITNGTVIASKAIITDSNKDITGGRNITITGELDAATLDISGDIDVDGTANLDNTDIDGTLNTSGVVTCQTSANISQVAISSSSNATAWDAAAAANAYYSTSENTTISAPSNAVEGAIISIEIAQGGTARTVAWNTVFEFAASTAPTVTATANKTDIFAFRYNGSVWQEIGRTQNMAQT
jgi:cytoskeletal protein CcmA (bactofilin family)